jgi:hypothetical protein
MLFDGMADELNLYTVSQIFFQTNYKPLQLGILLAQLLDTLRGVCLFHSFFLSGSIHGRIIAYPLHCVFIHSLLLLIWAGINLGKNKQ